MTDKITAARELHALLHQKCAELSARTSALIDHAQAGDDTVFVRVMIGESVSAVEFWADAIVKKVQE